MNYFLFVNQLRKHTVKPSGGDKGQIFFGPPRETLLKLFLILTFNGVLTPMWFLLRSASLLGTRIPGFTLAPAEPVLYGDR